MKKALSILLTLAMLATLCTVPAWAEEAEETIDIPVIEEVTEEELELFGEEVELAADSNFKTLEAAEGDGITLLTEIQGVAVTSQKVSGKNPEGDITSLYNGQLTVGNDLGESLIKNGERQEGFMVFKSDTITVDFGKKMAFSGIRVYETSRVRHFAVTGINGTPRPAARRLATSRVYFSDNGTEWYSIYTPTVTYNDEEYYGEIPFMHSANGAVNINARYIRFAATTISSGWGEFELEEIVMLDADGSLNTWSLDGNEISTSNIKSVTAGSQWNDNSYAAKNAYDNNLIIDSYWHSTPGNPDYDNDEARSLAIELNEAMEIGGVRLWPRKGNTATMRKVRLMSSENGTDWYNVTTVTSDLNSVFSTSGYTMPVDVLIPDTVSCNTKYIKIVAEKVDAYVCLAEFQLLSADIKGTPSAYVTDDDVVPFKTTPKEIKYYSSLGKGKATAAGMFDGKIYQVINDDEGYYSVYTGKGSADPHWEVDWAIKDNKGNPGYVTLDYDLGMEYTFSAVRLFGRWNQPGQSFTHGYLLVSDDGTNWYTTDLYTDAVTTVAIAAPGMRDNDNNVVANGKVQLGKYASTGEIYTDVSTTFGKDYNIKARYIRLYCDGTAEGNHWSMQELMLVKPDNGNETKTVAEIKTVLEAEALAVTNTLNALSSNASAKEIAAARKAYDGLSEGAKAFVDAAAYKKLTDAETLMKGSVYEIATTASNGLNKATFTLPVRDDMTIKSVIYTDTLGNAIDGTSATTVTNDGTNMTITMAGAYDFNTGLTSYSDESKGVRYFSRAQGYGWTVGQEVKASFFTGSFVRKVTADGIGDHFVTITFGDDSTATVNIKTTVKWVSLTSAAALTDSEYTDEITPKATWKSTTTIQNADLNVAFDGKAEYLLRKAGSSSGNRYESDYVAGYTADNAELTGDINQVLLYPPTRADFIIDMGEKTAVSGVRIYPRISTYDVDKTKGTTSGAPTKVRYWGSDDFENWTVLGDYTFTRTSEEKTALFSKIENYRYYKCSVVKANEAEYKTTINISEMTFLKPQVLVEKAETIIDAADIAASNEIAKFSLPEGVTFTSVKLNGNAIAATITNGSLTVTGEVLKTFANGENKLVAAFSNNQEVEFTVTITDTSKATYVLANDSTGRASEELSLINNTGKVVTGVKINDGDVALTFTQSEDLKTISVGRIEFRSKYELYPTMGLDTPGEVKLTATFEDTTTKEYTVLVTSQWMATGEVTATFEDDEIVPVAGEWKARASSVSSAANLPQNVLVKARKNTKDAQNWHTAFTSGKGDQQSDHYLDIDFGATPPTYKGIRLIERKDGSKYKLVTVSGKNADSEEWTEVYSGSAGVSGVYVYDLVFEKAVNYRYLRLRIDGQSEHVTIDTLHFLKDSIKLDSDAEVIVDADNRTAVTYKIYLPKDAAGDIMVWANSVELAEDKYTWDNETGILTISAEYVKTLEVGTTGIKVEVDSTVIDGLTIEVKNLYTTDYHFTLDNEGRGTEDLVLNIPEGKTVSTLKYGDKDVAFTQAEGKITVKRFVLRNLDAFFEVDKITLKGTFTDETTQDYVINFHTASYSVAAGDAAAFEEDEIVSSSDWTASTMSIHSTGNGIAPAFSKTGGYWHSAYTEDRTDPNNIAIVADSYEGKHYIVLSVPGEGVTFSGIRYYSRTDNLAGTWDGVTIYVKDATDEEWTLVKSQAFNFDSIEATKMATVYFDEAVSASKILIVADAGGYKYATAKAITLLAKGAKAPAADEGEVKIDVTPTAGGNVYVDREPSLGSNYVAANGEITLTADAEGFKYWVDAHTGRILGNDAAGLTVKATVGKDIKAVFADPTEYEAFYAFLGRNGDKLVSSGYVKKGAAPVAPTATQLYTTGYEFTKWVDKTGADLDATAAITADTVYFAVYEAKDNKQAKITVANGTVQKADESDEAAAETTYAYDTKVKVMAAEAPEGQKFAYWTINGAIVCYTETYIFFVPDMDTTVTAVYVAEDEVVTREIGITMAMSTSEIDGASVASFLTTRIVPEGFEVLETGVIYVKDGAATDLTIDKIGETAANGNKVKVALSAATASGQYKLTAKYTEWGGIAARGFITYKDGDTVKTVYTTVLNIEGGEL